MSFRDGFRDVVKNAAIAAFALVLTISYIKVIEAATVSTATPGQRVKLVKDAKELYSAVLGGDQVSTRRLAPDLAKVPIYDAYGFTPLIWAAGQHSTAIAAVLIDCGFDVDLGGRGSGFTPLMMAATRGNADMVRLLLDHGANRNARDKDAETALSIATQRKNASVVGLLTQPERARQ